MQYAAKQLTLFPDAAGTAGSEAGNPGASDFSVRESARARRLSIKVFPRGKVEVVVPRRTPARDVEAFVVENRAWIDDAVASFAAQFGEQCQQLPDIVELPAIGQTIVVRYQQQRGTSAVRTRYAAGTLYLKGNVADRERCVKALQRWLGRVARQEFEPLLRRYASEYDLPFGRLQVRAQRTCWGSRSTTGTLSINLCLLFLAPAIVRYLMIHELCHGRHMNHSRAFWRLVRRHEPDYRRLDRALSEGWKAVPAWLGIY